MIPNPFDVLDPTRLFGAIGKWVLLIVVVLGIFVAPSCAAYRLGWQARDAQARDAAHERAEGDLKALIEIMDINARAAGDYVLRRASSRARIESLRPEVPRVTSTYKPTPAEPAQPLPRCVFTRGFVRVWDAALQAGTSTPAAAGSTAVEAAAPAGAADPADLLDAGIDQADVLDNHVDNADVTAAIRDQCEALRLWAAEVTRVR